MSTTVGSSPVTTDPKLAREIADVYGVLADTLDHREKLRDAAKYFLGASPWVNVTMERGPEGEIMQQALGRVICEKWVELIGTTLERQDRLVQRARVEVAAVLARVVPDEYVQTNPPQ